MFTRIQPSLCNRFFISWKHNVLFSSYLTSGDVEQEPAETAKAPEAEGEQQAEGEQEEKGIYINGKLIIVRLLKIQAYEGDSICNEITLITPPTHGLELYTIYMG